MTPVSPPISMISSSIPQLYPAPTSSALDEFSLTGLIKDSNLRSDPFLAQQLHAKSIRAGLSFDPGIRSSLIATYSALGSLDSSRLVFDELPPALETDVPTWNSIISTYVRHGRHAESFKIFSAMIGNAHLLPTDATYVIVIGACTPSRDIELGKALHGRIVKERVVDEVKVLNCLITFYAKCGEVEEARKVFDASGGTNVVSWNAMIAGYEQNGKCELALELFSMLNSDACQSVNPNRITFLSVFSAVSTVTDLRLGKEVHGRVIGLGFESETSIGNSLITMYGKCGEVAKGRLVFERLPCRDVVTWNSMLAGYAQNEESENCYTLFVNMKSAGIKPDDRTLTIILSAVSSESSISNSCKLGREIHGYLLRRSVSKELHVSVCTAIIAMYAKSSRIREAEKIFKSMSERDTYTWNAMMDAYSTCGHCDDALALFVNMLDQGLKFDHRSLSIILTVCGRLVSDKLGRQFHAFALKHQVHLCNSKCSLLSVENALLSMYAKCGCIADAGRVFQQMAKRDVFSWTAMITGYAHHGMAYESLRLFERMRRGGIKPNSVTFLGLLTACAHAGLVQEGIHYFNMMQKESGNEPSIEHYACMVDLFGRSGQLERAEAMVETGISHLTPKNGSCMSLWKVLLGACHAHKQLELGKRAAARIFELEPENETTHVLLSNLYASFGLWRQANEMRRRMRETGLRKEAGCSWVEVGSRRHVFVAGDVCHPNRKEIYEKLVNLDEKCRRIGYIPMTELVLHDVSESRKEAILGCHGEKLAASFVILQTSMQRDTIRVIKNLRVCSDCHNWMKFVSQVEEREIVLRDSKRFHSFKHGNCSCGDYW